MSSCLALSSEEKERNSRNNIRAILHLLGYYDHDPDHQLIETTLHHDQNPSKNHRQIHLLPYPPLPLHKRKRSFSRKRKFVPSDPLGDYNDPDNDGDGDGDISSCISIDDHGPATRKNQDLPYTLVFQMAGERKVLLRPKKCFGDAAAEEKQLKKRNKMTVKKETPGEAILPRHYPLGLPQKFKKLIGDMGGSDSEAVLVIQKNLFKTDVSKNHGRLSMPVSQTSTEFLTAEETRALNSKRELAVELIEPMTLAKRGLRLTKWAMGKNGTYNLVGNWNSVLVENGLEEGMVVQLWAFRVDSVLHIALVVVNQE
ncbi:hypothetical protein RJ639_030633 [Escallonia herrerae]|uniref:B3 domain-containing protein n=1 Tax=Escallonia herrerae TaxID=1293975 RepID=A0AA88X1Y7_9ASTE|nr:hypothetical protein RJ639_030633 [Escallonia herrerae]